MSPLILREVLKKEREADINCKEDFNFIKECIDQAELDLTAGMEPGKPKTYLYALSAVPSGNPQEGQPSATSWTLPPILLPNTQNETGNTTFEPEEQVRHIESPRESQSRSPRDTPLGGNLEMDYQRYATDYDSRNVSPFNAEVNEYEERFQNVFNEVTDQLAPQANYENQDFCKRDSGQYTQGKYYPQKQDYRDDYPNRGSWEDYEEDNQIGAHFPGPRDYEDYDEWPNRSFSPDNENFKYYRRQNPIAESFDPPLNPN